MKSCGWGWVQHSPPPSCSDGWALRNSSFWPGSLFTHTHLTEVDCSSQEDRKREQKCPNFSRHDWASRRRPNLSRHITECSKCHENHCFLIFFLGAFEWGDLWELSILRVIRHFLVARQSNQQLFALNQAEKLSVTTRRYDLSGWTHHV